MENELPGRSRFQWKDLGDMTGARPNLGIVMNVLVYRLMQYALKDVLAERYGADAAGEIVREAGQLAGEEFCRNMLDTGLAFNPFVALLQERLKSLGIGILRIEKADPVAMEFVLTVAEDLECSGLPVSGETVCEYDEGFISGIFSVYTGKPFSAREVDCWATGERTCRFVTKPAEEDA